MDELVKLFYLRVEDRSGVTATESKHFSSLCGNYSSSYSSTRKHSCTVCIQNNNLDGILTPREPQANCKAYVLKIHETNSAFSR